MAISRLFKEFSFKPSVCKIKWNINLNNKKYEKLVEGEELVFLTKERYETKTFSEICIPFINQPKYYLRTTYQRQSIFGLIKIDEPFRHLSTLYENIIKNEIQSQTCIGLDLEINHHKNMISIYTESYPELLESNIFAKTESIRIHEKEYFI